MNNKFSIENYEIYTANHRIPYSVHWTITEKCNLRCSHCFLSQKQIETKLEDALYIIDFLKEKGFFKVALSGGECLLHPHFKEIYTALKKAGMHIDIFTNGTVLTDKLKQLFIDMKPAKMEISIYGDSDEAYFNSTSSRNAYSSLIKTFDFLKEQNIHTTIKAPITKFNIDSIDNFIEIAKNYQFDYKFATYIFKASDGSDAPLNCRVDYQSAVDIEIGHEKNFDGFISKIKKYGLKGISFVEKCSACRNAFTINADNSFSFCGIMLEPKFHFTAETIERAFNQVNAYRQDVIDMYNQSPCSKCAISNACTGCPAHLIRENGNYNMCNQYLKQMTNYKIELIKNEIDTSI